MGEVVARGGCACRDWLALSAIAGFPSSLAFQFGDLRVRVRAADDAGGVTPRLRPVCSQAVRYDDFIDVVVAPGYFPLRGGGIVVVCHGRPETLEPLI